VEEALSVSAMQILKEKREGSLSFSWWWHSFQWRKSRLMLDDLKDDEEGM
jgi:hypothetical protein